MIFKVDEMVLRNIVVGLVTQYVAGCSKQSANTFSTLLMEGMQRGKDKFEVKTLTKHHY